MENLFRVDGNIDRGNKEQSWGGNSAGGCKKTETGAKNQLHAPVMHPVL